MREYHDDGLNTRRVKSQRLKQFQNSISEVLKHSSSVRLDSTGSSADSSLQQSLVRFIHVWLTLVPYTHLIALVFILNMWSTVGHMLSGFCIFGKDKQLSCASRMNLLCKTLYPSYTAFAIKQPTSEVQLYNWRLVSLWRLAACLSNAEIPRLGSRDSTDSSQIFKLSPAYAYASSASIQHKHILGQQQYNMVWYPGLLNVHSESDTLKTTTQVHQ